MSESATANSSTLKATTYRVNLNRSRFDQTTFLGRFRHFLNVTDPRTLFTTDQKLKESIKLLEDYENGRDIKVTEEQLWQAKKLKDAIIHPDTGEKILWPFRMSAFVPMNTLIAVGLLTPNPTIIIQIFWQWINQSMNIAVNHANRNASNQMSNKQISEAYVVSVLSSCSIAVGLSQLVKRSDKLSPILRTTIKRYVPFTAVASANVINVFLMRRNEISEGIVVKDEHGEVLGKSPTAGMRAVTQVAISRVIITMPVLTIPPLIMGYLEKTKFISANPRLAIPLNIAVCALSLAAGVPTAIALFPQMSKLPVEKLEPEFRNIVKNGRKVTHVYYNKGL
jgi:tricarboxylate carrier